MKKTNVYLVILSGRNELIDSEIFIYVVRIKNGIRIRILQFEYFNESNKLDLMNLRRSFRGSAHFRLIATINCHHLYGSTRTYERQSRNRLEIRFAGSGQIAINFFFFIELSQRGVLKGIFRIGFYSCFQSHLFDRRIYTNKHTLSAHASILYSIFIVI